MNDNNRELLPFRRSERKEETPLYVVNARQIILDKAERSLKIAMNNTGYSEPQAEMPPEENGVKSAQIYELDPQAAAKPAETDQHIPEQGGGETQETGESADLSMEEQARRDALRALSEGQDSLDAKLADLGYGTTDEREAA